MTSLNVTRPLHMTRTIGLCFLVALMEGLDLQAAGIAAQGMAAAFELDKLQMSWVFSAGIFGLLPGAFFGGLLADRIGRKRVLMGRGLFRDGAAGSKPLFGRSAPASAFFPLA